MLGAHWRITRCLLYGGLPSVLRRHSGVLRGARQLMPVLRRAYRSPRHFKDLRSRPQARLGARQHRDQELVTNLVINRVRTGS